MKIFFSGIEELINEDGNPTSTGLAQAQTVFEKVKQRNCQESIVGLSYGTTASNTGKDRGAMVRLQRLLDVPLLSTWDAVITLQSSWPRLRCLIFMICI